ncbi:peptidase family M13 [Ostertagia ostertagi]
MKPKMDPCKDFYSFACGSFATNRVVPEHEKKINVLFEMEKEHKLHLKGLFFTDTSHSSYFSKTPFSDILEDSSSGEESEAMTLSRTYYNSCMDEEVSGGRLQIYGVDGLIRVFVQRGFEDSEAQLIMVCADMDDDTAGIEYQVNDIIDLERRIANVAKKLLAHLGPMDDNVTVNLYDLGYFEGLSALVKSKPLSCINNYMMFRLVSSFDVYLSQQYRRPLQQFHSNMYGKTAEAIEMIGDFKNSMKTLLLDAEWMDETTRAAALKKLETMRYKIGFPDYIFNETEVLRPFKGVHLVADRYFDNALELRKASIRDNLNDLRRKPGLDEWAFPVIAVDAFYSFTGNEIVFPAGILQYPIFIPEAPFYLNYASIGIAVGHEITHGYDDLGAQYDANGSLRGWWDEGTLETFRQRRQCFINQYGKQVEPATHKNVDGRSSIGENIADNGGMRLAYEVRTSL